MTQPSTSQPPTCARRAFARPLGLLTPLFLAACSIAPPIQPADPKVPPPPTQAGCRADDAGFAIGQALTTPLLEEARQRAGAGSVRALRPDQAVTLEYNPARLNLDVDATGKVTRVRCG
jgi:hypothetical protein